MGEAIPRIPDLDLPQYRFILIHGPKELHAKAKEQLLAAIAINSKFFFLLFILKDLVKKF